MTSGPHPHTLSPPPRRASLRLRLKPMAAATGYVDGAWWPMSRDLTVALPALASVLAVRLGQVQRVAYSLSAWDPAPRRFEVAGYRVRLEGFSYQNRNVIHVTGSNRGRISLLVVPPEMTDAAGHDALMIAGRRGNADLPEEILAAFSLPRPRVAPDNA